MSNSTAERMTARGNLPSLDVADIARLKQLWESSPSLRAEFSEFLDFQGWHLAKLRGHIGRVAEPRASSHRTAVAPDGLPGSRIKEPVRGAAYCEAFYSAQYDDEPALQEEFRDKASYLAFCRHMCRGGIRLARR